MINDLILYTPMYVTFFWALVLLLTGRKKSLPRFFLGVFMSVAFLVYFSHAVFFQGDLKTYLYFDPVYIFSSLAVYPLYFWYIKLLTVETRLKWINLWLLFPAALFAAATFLNYNFMNDEDMQLYISEFLVDRSGFPEGSPAIKVQKAIFYGSQIVFICQVILFLVLGRKLVLQYHKKVAEFYSNLESKTLMWVNYLLYSFVITSTMSIIVSIIGRNHFTGQGFLLAIASFFFSTLLFIIGILGYLQNHSVLQLEKDEEEQTPIDLKKVNASQLKTKLLEIFDNEKAYRKPELKITEVSHRLGTNRTYISTMINTEFSCSFNEFVNKYRIEEAKRLINEDSLDHFSLSYIAESAGFGSVGTFIRAFKDFEGMTPGQYRELTKLQEAKSKK